MKSRPALLPLLGLAVALSGCAGAKDPRPSLGPAIPVGVGPGARFRPAPTSTRVARALPVAGLGCAARGRARAAAHVELFARGHVVLVPAGVGIAPPLRRRGAYVTGGRCSYALRTREPTGLIELDPTRGPLTLGAFFALWGHPLSRWRLGPFAAGRGGRVEAWVDGRRWPGDPRGIPLRRHSAVVLQVQGNLPPHTGYRFPPGL